MLERLKEWIKWLAIPLLGLLLFLSRNKRSELQDARLQAVDDVKDNDVKHAADAAAGSGEDYKAKKAAYDKMRGNQ